MFKGLRTQLLLWTILPLGAILIAVAYLGVNSHQTAMREMVAEREGAVAHVAAAQWSQSLALHASLLPKFDPRLPAQCDPRCAAFDGGIALFDAQGNLLQAQPSSEPWQHRRMQTASLLNVRDVAFSLPFIEDNAIQLLIAVPQGDHILMGAFAPPPITDLGFGARGIAYLADAHGKIIAHPNPAELGGDMAQHDGISEVIRGEMGATFHHANNGTEYVIGYAPITPTNWGLLVEEPWEEIVAPMFQYSVLLPLMLALAASVALAAVYFGVRNVVSPLQNLAQAANRIANGDYRAATQPVGGVGEIEALRETLDAMAHKVSAAQDAMQNYITAITRGQEDERLRLARELHDDTIQSLIALQQRVEMTQKALSKDPVLAAARLQEFKDLLTDTLVSVRHFVSDLRPTYLSDLGLVPALELLARQANARFEIVGEETRLDAEPELALYRIIQEALRNVTKHAHAAMVSVRLSFEAHEFTATIEDNGVGFVPPESPSAYARMGHFGLMGMQERAQLFSGNVRVNSERGKGTRITVTVPISATVKREGAQPSPKK